MKLIDKVKNMSKKQKIIGIVSIIVVILILIVICMFIVTKNRTVTEAENRQLDTFLEIPDITEDNIKFNMQILEDGQRVTIELLEKLEDYNLYYLTEEIADTEEEELVDDTSGISDSIQVNKDDYSTYSLLEKEIQITENSNIYWIYEKDGKYSINIYTMQITNIVKPLQTEEEVSQEQLDTEKVDKNNKVNSKSPYYIKVNYGANVVTVYQKDESGNYSIPVKAMVCSCGTSTPKSGTYKTSRGREWGTLFGGVYGHYSTRIVGSILFHSVPYTAPSSDSLEWWEFDKLGTKASMGCIRLQVKDAKWIFDNCGSGTMVEFYSSADPGPLGKPSAPKITNNERCRNWDPTENISGNPWFENQEPVLEIDQGNIITDDTILTD